jgi:hypothetical protein
MDTKTLRPLLRFGQARRLTRAIDIGPLIELNANRRWMMVAD